MPTWFWIALTCTVLPAVCLFLVGGAAILLAKIADKSL